MNGGTLSNPQHDVISHVFVQSLIHVSFVQTGKKIIIKSLLIIHANLANFRFFLKLLGGFVALDKVDVSHKTSA